MSFWKNNEKEFLNSKEYESLAKKLTELFGKIEEIGHKVAIVETDNANLRGLLNRKLKGLSEEDKKDINMRNPFLPDGIIQ